jgi:hypothetical protein
MYDYWSQVSMGAVTLKGTTIFPWVPLNRTTNQDHYLDGNPSNQAPSNSRTTGDRVQYCIDQTKAYFAASNQPLDLSRFYGVFVIQNENGGEQTAGGSYGGTPAKGAPFFEFSSLTLTTAAHEMGHGYGLAHAEDTAYNHWCGDSINPSNPNPSNPNGYGDYCDYYDVMGAPYNGGVNFTTPAFGAQGLLSGPGLNAEHLDYLGWIPTARHYALGLSAACVTLKLAALGHTEVPNTGQAPTYFDVGIPFSNSITIPIRGALPGGYTVEFRRATGWDRGMTDGVIIHSGWSSNGYAETFIVDNNGGPLWHPGDTFTDNVNNVRISINSFDLVGNTAEISICRAGVPPPPGQPPTCALTFSCPYPYYTPPDFTIQCATPVDFWDVGTLGIPSFLRTDMSYSRTSGDVEEWIRTCVPGTSFCSQYPVGKSPQEWCAPPPPPPPPGGGGGKKGGCPGGICQ